MKITSDQAGAGFPSQPTFKEVLVPAKLFGRSAVLTITSAMAMSFSSSLPIHAAGFTEDQATAGQTDYQSSCANCHGANLEGTEAPGLFGQDVMGNWDTAGGLYDFIAVAMPPTQPGELGEESYLNIVAYIMQKNGAEPGDDALTMDNMESISLVAETKEGAKALEASMEAAESDEEDTNVPQAFTWGKELPTYESPTDEAADEATEEAGDDAAAEPAAEPTSEPADDAADEPAEEDAN